MYGKNFQVTFLLQMYSMEKMDSPGTFEGLRKFRRGTPQNTAHYSVSDPLANAVLLAEK